MTLRPRPVDPRDITIEESDPTYRVYFWADDGRYCREYDLEGADVVEDAIAWANENVRGGERYILGVRWPEQFRPPGSAFPEVAFIRLKRDPPPGQSVGRRQGS